MCNEIDVQCNTLGLGNFPRFITIFQQPNSGGFELFYGLLNSNLYDYFKRC